MQSVNVLYRYLRARRQLASGGSKWSFLFAWFLSLFFHPLLIPTWSALVILQFSPELLPLTGEGRTGILGFLFFSTFVLPAGGIGLLWASGLIRSISMDERKDRHLPHLLAFICFLSVAVLFDHFLPVLSITYCLMLGSAVSVGVTGMITLFWKISSHLVGLGGFLGIQLALAIMMQPQDFLIPLLLSILICGAVASARLYLGAHNIAQIMAGFFLGMVISSITVTFFAGFF